ncbi:MAG: hypothetical protein KJ955_07830 [Nanoarchaeota archaeon]|nr:hypothetical protein [Nanoarchaeota archaeon]
MGRQVIIDALEEYVVSAKENEDKMRLRAALTLYFKALVEGCDLLLYDKILKVPSNHTERYELLQRFFPDIYKIASPLFAVYRKSYSQVVTKEDVKKVKDGANAIKEKAKAL